MIGRLRRKSLAFQILVPGLLITVAVFALVFHIQTRAIKDTIYALVEAHAAQTAPIAAAAFSTALAQNDFASLQAIVAESVSMEGVAQISVTNPSGKVVAQEGAVQEGEVLFVKLVPLSIAGQSLGMARLTFSDRVASKLLGDLALKRLGFLAGVSILVCAGLTFLAMRMAKPLREMGAAANALAQGQFDVTFNPVAPAEVQRLQAHFTTMAKAVQSKIAAVKASETLQLQYLQIAERKAAESSLAAEAANAARQAAETANAAKSQFLSKVSHEVRTPLSGMLGMLDLLKDSKLDESQRELTNVARGSGESLLAIINDILDFSKIEMGQFAVDRQPYALRALLTSVTRLFTVSASAKGVILQLDMHDDLPAHALGDALRMRQILSNLISNAIKFTDGGQVMVAAWCNLPSSAPVEHQDGANAPSDPSMQSGELFLSVSDTGVGVEADALQAIFEPFVQADNSATRRFGGTGLGLSIVKNLVEAMGGDISVSSFPGKGSTFTVRMPLSVAQEPSGTGQEPMSPQAVSLTGMRVLIVEDNEINLKLAQRIVAKFGCETDTATNGLLAVEKIESTHFDVVLMDCQMPVMDGLEATAAVRERESKLGLSRLAIIAVTANASDADREACLAHGMDDCLSKPYVALTLNAALAKHWQLA